MTNVTNNVPVTAGAFLFIDFHCKSIKTQKPRVGLSCFFQRLNVNCMTEQIFPKYTRFSKVSKVMFALKTSYNSIPSVLISVLYGVYVEPFYRYGKL